LRYRPFAGTAFTMYELVTGPLNASIFPNRDLDSTLSPESLFFNGPAAARDVTTWADAKRWSTLERSKLRASGRSSPASSTREGTRAFR
jgi:hypothetical protein